MPAAVALEVARMGFPACRAARAEPSSPAGRANLEAAPAIFPAGITSRVAVTGWERRYWRPVEVVKFARSATPGMREKMGDLAIFRTSAAIWPSAPLPAVL